MIAGLSGFLAQVDVGGSSGSSGAAGSAGLPKLVLPHVEYHLLIPQLVVIGSAVVLLAATSLSRTAWPRRTYALWSAATGLFAAGWGWHLWHDIVRKGAAGAPTQATSAVSHAVAVDGFSLFLIITLSCALVLGSLAAESYLAREGLDGPEFYVLAMLCTSGAMIMASANDLIVLFLGLEILSISLYVLTAYHHRRIQSGEAAIKYFVLGAFSSAFFLYGVALVYGATGSTGLGPIASFLATNDVSANGLLLAGAMLMLVGLGFKVAAVPFHVWTPDVYQGAPTPVTGFMAAAAKAAGFAALLRVFLAALGTQASDWVIPIGALAVLTLFVGAVLAVVQTNVKRMLAYSSISHAGFVMLGLWAAGQQLLGKGSATGATSGRAAALFYLLAYTFMIIGTFAVVALVGGKGDGHHGLAAYRGLAERRPALALGFTILLLGQAGVPFTSGFFAKFYVIGSAVSVGSTWGYVLGLIGMLSAVIAAFFYLRIVLATYSPLAAASSSASSASSGGGTAVAVVEAPARLEVPVTAGVVVFLCVAFTIAFGLAPGLIVHFATKATLLF
jgi:NADH-quinone oxidoreductase subunit N